MDQQVRFEIEASPEQAERLQTLQRAFAQACNDVSPVVQERRLWNRVTLHHLLYRNLRDAHPKLGSQLVCNAIYAVCRSARLVYQSPVSPFNHLTAGGARLPLLRFAESSPVFFDRRTLSVRNGVASIFTLDGRIRCPCAMTPEEESYFVAARVHEVMLQRNASGSYELLVDFQDSATGPARLEEERPALFVESLPGYLQVEEAA